MKTDFRKKIVLYGAGDYGRKLLHYFRKQSIEPDYFCQTEVEDESSLVEGIPIISIDRLVSMKACVYVAIEDKNISKQIRHMLSDLSEMGTRELEIYECSDFVKLNLTTSDLNKKCLICTKEIDQFMPGGNDFNLFKKAHVIGGGVRKSCICPNCGSMDRTRWCFRNLRKYTDIFTKQCRVLHIAPENVLRDRICENKLCDYYAGDLFPDRTMNKIDVTDIQFADNSFDYIIMNHVMEHIRNEGDAISELKRVLKPDGIIALSFPICTDFRTIEETCEMTEQEHIKKFGQADHVRLYGTDYKKRLEQYGLKITIHVPKNEVAEDDISRLGFIEDDVCLFCKK